MVSWCFWDPSLFSLLSLHPKQILSMVRHSNVYGSGVTKCISNQHSKSTIFKADLVQCSSYCRQTQGYRVSRSVHCALVHVTINAHGILAIRVPRWSTAPSKSVVFVLNSYLSLQPSFLKSLLQNFQYQFLNYPMHYEY